MSTLPVYGNTALLGSALFLHATDSREHVAWLSRALSGQGLISSMPLDEGALKDAIARKRPRAVFIDFSGEQVPRSAALASALRRSWPDLVLIALGHASQTPVTLAALRAGVDDFVDLDGPTESVLPLLRERLAQREPTQAPATNGRTLALLGARAGLGTTTLASNLAAALRHMATNRRPATKGAPPPGDGKDTTSIALLDLGLPARDALLYLGLQSSFSFVEAVQNAHRFDHTLIETALAHHANGTAVLPLPAELAQVRDISYSQSVNFVRLLRSFFDLQIIDLGGFTTYDFLAHMARQADQVWVMCDQSVGAAVSTASLLRELREREVATEGFALVVNAYEPAVDLLPQDIARQLALPLAHVLPSRRQTLLAAATRGKLAVDDAPNDAWSRAVKDMAQELLPWISGGEPPERTAPVTRPVDWLGRWLRPWKHQG